MAERLTKKISKTIQDKYSLGQYLYYDFAGLDDINKLLNKLGKLEDILEKYGIENVEELEEKLNEPERIWNANLKDLKQQVKREINKELEQDRDTWKRACELACEHISTVHIITNDDMLENQSNLSTYFYQQAKKEGDTI